MGNGKDPLDTTGSGRSPAEFQIWAQMSINNALKEVREMKVDAKALSDDTTRKVTTFHTRQNALETENATLKQKVADLEKENDQLRTKLDHPEHGLVAIKTRQTSIMRIGGAIGAAAMSGVASILIWLWTKA